MRKNRCLFGVKKMLITPKYLSSVSMKAIVFFCTFVFETKYFI